MAVVFPSTGWLEELRNRINTDETYRKVAANWEGDYLCLIELDETLLKDLQNPKTLAGMLSLIAMIPREKIFKFEGTPAQVFLEKLGIPLGAEIDPAKLDLKQMARRAAEIKLEEVKGTTIYIWLDFWHGQLRNTEVVAPGDHADAKFVLSGPYAAYKEMVEKMIDPTTMILRGKLRLRGDIAYMMRNAAAVLRYSFIQSSIPVDKDP